MYTAFLNWRKKVTCIMLTSCCCFEPRPFCLGKFHARQDNITGRLSTEAECKDILDAREVWNRVAEGKEVLRHRTQRSAGKG